MLSQPHTRPDLSLSFGKEVRTSTKLSLEAPVLQSRQVQQDLHAAAWRAQVGPVEQLAVALHAEHGQRICQH